MLETYYIIKVIHVVFATIVVAASFGMAIWVTYNKYCASQQQYQSTLNKALYLSLFVVIPGCFIQMLSGFTIIGLKHYSMHLLWVWVTATGFVGFLITQLLAAFHLKQLTSNIVSSSLEKKWLSTLALSALILIIMVFMMANRVS